MHDRTNRLPSTVNNSEHELYWTEVLEEKARWFLLQRKRLKEIGIDIFIGASELVATSTHSHGGKHIVHVNAQNSITPISLVTKNICIATGSISNHFGERCIEFKTINVLL